MGQNWTKILYLNLLKDYTLSQANLKIMIAISLVAMFLATSAIKNKMLIGKAEILK
jgi:hypothetical protein